MAKRNERVIHLFALVALVANLFAPVFTLPVFAEDIDLGDNVELITSGNDGESGDTSDDATVNTVGEDGTSDADIDPDPGETGGDGTGGDDAAPAPDGTDAIDPEPGDTGNGDDATDRTSEDVSDPAPDDTASNDSDPAPDGNDVVDPEPGPDAIDSTGGDDSGPPPDGTEDESVDIDTDVTGNTVDTGSDDDDTQVVPNEEKSTVPEIAPLRTCGEFCPGPGPGPTPKVAPQNPIIELAICPGDGTGYTQTIQPATGPDHVSYVATAPDENHQVTITASRDDSVAWNTTNIPSGWAPVGNTYVFTFTLTPCPEVGEPEPASLTLTKTARSEDHTADVTEVALQQSFVFRIDVENSGGTEASTYTFTDTIPEGLTLTSIAYSSDQQACTPETGPAGTVVTCIGTALGFDDYQGHRYFLHVKVDADVCKASISNNVWPGEGPWSSPYESVATVSVSNPAPCPSNVTLTKTADVDSVAPGGQISYTVAITNASDSSLPWSFTDSLPTGVSMDPNDWSAQWYANSDPGTVFNSDAGDVTCSLAGSILTCSAESLLGAGFTDIITYTVTVDQTAVCDSELTNSVAGTWSGADASHADLVTTDVTCPPEPEPDITIEKTGTVNTVNQSILFTITLTNHTDEDKGNVAVIDTLPPELAELDWWQWPNNVCENFTHTGSTITCWYLTIPANGSSSVSFAMSYANANLACGQTFTNLASWQFGVTGPTGPIGQSETSGNGYGINSVPPTALGWDTFGIAIPCPEGDLIKTVDKETVEPGGTLVYTVDASGDPNAVHRIGFVDTLPEGVTYEGSVAKIYFGGDKDELFDSVIMFCTPNGQEITCEHKPNSAPPVNSAYLITITVSVDDDAVCGSVLNNTVAGIRFLNGHSDSASTTVVCTGEDLIKTVDKTVVEPGGTLTYQIRGVNNSDSSQRVGVLDPLPDGVTLVGTPTVEYFLLSDPDQLSSGLEMCSSQGQTITCEYPATAKLREQRGFLVTITVKVDSDAVCDSVLENNVTGMHFLNGHSDSASTTVVCDPDLEIKKELTSHENGIAAPGDTITFQVTVDNTDENTAAEDVYIVDTMDPVLQSLDWTPLPDGCEFDDDDRIICGPYDIAAEGEKTLPFSAEIPLDGSVCSDTWLSNTAEISFIEVEGEPGVGSNFVDVGPKESPGPDGGDDPSSDSAKVKINCDPDIQITKSGPNHAKPGDEFTYEIIVTNTGNTELSGYQVTDQIDLNYLSIEDVSGALCDAEKLESGLLDCAVITLVPDGAEGDSSQTITITVKVRNDLSPQQCKNGKFSNQAFVAQLVEAEPGPDKGVQKIDDPRGDGYPREQASPHDESDVVNTSIKNCKPKVKIEKAQGKKTKWNGVEPGGTITYTLTVMNTGNVDLTDIKVLDLLTGGLTYIDAESTENCDLYWGTTVTCVIDTLDHGESIDLTIKVKTSKDPKPRHCNAVFWNQARIIKHSHMKKNGSEIKSNWVGTYFDCDPEISVTKKDNLKDKKVTPGETFIYTIKVKNTGNIPLTSVDLTDTLPPALITPEWVDTDDMTCTGLVCELDGKLKPGESQTLKLQVTFDTDLSKWECKGVTNWATAKAKSAAGKVWDSDKERSTPKCKTSYEFSKVADKETVEPGGTISYTITLKNTGTIDISQAPIEDTVPDLPGEVEWDIAISSGITCYPFPTIADGEELACGLTENLPPGGEVWVKLSAAVPDSINLPEVEDAEWCRPWTNTAGILQINWSNEDYKPRTDREATVQVNCTGVNIVKDGPESVIPGETIVYTLIVTNMGNTDVNNITVTDSLDSRLSNITATIGEDACNVSGQDVECLIDSLESLGVVEIEITALVVEMPTTEQCDELLENFASIASINQGGSEMLPSAARTITIPQEFAFKSNTVETDIDCTPEIEFEKSVASESVAPGEDIVFTITATNTGTYYSEPGPIVDELPEGIAHLDWDVEVAPEDSLTECDIEEGVLTCEPVHLAAYDGLIQITLTAGTDDQDPVCGMYSNTASMGDYSDTADVSIECVPDYSVEKTSDSVSTMLAVNDTIEYTITVTNTGNQPLTGITMSDVFTGAGDLTWLNDFDPDSPMPEIPVAGSLDIQTTYIVTQDDVDAGNIENCVYLTYPVENGDPLEQEDCVDDDITQNPGFNVVKTSTLSEDSDVLTAGNTVTYTFTVTNTGSVTLTNIDVTDRIEDVVFANDNHTIALLAPGESATLTATYVVTNDDVDEGMIVNCADATAETPTGTELVGDSCDTRLVDQDLAIFVAHECPGPTVDFLPTVGEAVTFMVTVTNTGTVTITNVDVQMSREGTFDAPFPSVFAAGQSETRAWTVIATEADIAAREITLEVIVTADGPNGANALVASMAAMQSVGDTAEGSLMFSCPMGEEPKPAKVPAVDALPNTGTGNVASTFSVLWAATVLSMVAIGTTAVGVRRFNRR